MAVGLVVALARWAPDRFESALRWAAGRGLSASAEPRSADPELQTLRRQARRRLVRALEKGTLRRPVEFARDEVQALASDPQGPLGGKPANLRVQLLDGRARLSWTALPFEWPRWLGERLGVPMELVVEPAVEEGRVDLRVRAARVAGVRLPEWIAARLASSLPAAPRLDRLEETYHLPGLDHVEIQPLRLILQPRQATQDSGGVRERGREWRWSRSSAQELSPGA